MILSKKDTVIVNETGGQMSDFSSLGVTPDLKLKPDITAPGGSIYSTIPTIIGSYGSDSGTSMATPHMSGMSAILRQYVRATRSNLTAEQQRDLIDQLLMSTAKPVKQNGNNVYYSPRKQGAGLANVNAAVTTEAYLSVEPDEDGNVRPRINLGDDANKTGSYILTFKVNNMSDEKQTYHVDTTVLMDGLTQESGQLFIAKEAVQLLNGTDVAISINGSMNQEISVHANESTEVMITLTLTDAGKEKYVEFENGDFIEGFVELIPVNGVNNDISLTIPFMGFYGNWAKAPILEEGTWYDNTETYLTYPFQMRVNDRENEKLLGSNDAKESPYHTELFALSPNNDGYADKITTIDYGLLRNAATVEYTVEDSEGTIVFRDSVERMAKSTWDKEDDMIFPETGYLEEHPIKSFDGTDAQGKVLEDGDYLYKIKATIDYEHTEGNVRDTYVVPFKIDTVAPTFHNVRIVKEEDKLFLKGSIEENNALMTIGILKDAIIAQDVYDDGTNKADFAFDVTAYEGQSITLYGIDYASNEQNSNVQIVAPEEKEVTEKEMLASSLIKAQNLIEYQLLGDMDISVMTVFRARFNQAGTIYQNTTSTMEEFMLANTNLMNAMNPFTYTVSSEQLQKLIDEYTALDLSKYVENSAMTRFKAALKHAQTTEVDKTATYEALVDARSKLNLAQGKIDMIYLDFLMLKGNIIVNNERIVQTETDSWSTFTKALATAKQEKKDGISQQAVNDAANTLAKAYGNIRIVSNETTQKELIGFVEMIDQLNTKEYHSETMEFFLQTRVKVKALIDSDSFTMTEYEEVLSLLAEVIVRIDHDKVTPEGPIDPIQPGKDTETGDTTQTGLLMGGCITAGCVVIILLWKRRNRKDRTMTS